MNIAEIVIPGSREKDIILDLNYSVGSQDLIIFCHGYKGFKDWGCWSMVSDFFVKRGVSFLKFNFSFNGGTVDDPIDFPDPESFGKNNYTTELEDLGKVMDWVKMEAQLKRARIHLVGHSRGGGIALLKAAQDTRVSTVTTWAGVSDFGSRFPSGEELELWKQGGIQYVANARTGQQLPLEYQFYEDFLKHEDRLNIQQSVERLTIPTCVIHAQDDLAVDVSEARNILKWRGVAESLVLESGGHTFGSKHPWANDELPEALRLTCECTLNFIKN